MLFCALSDLRSLGHLYDGRLLLPLLSWRFFLFFFRVGPAFVLQFWSLLSRVRRMKQSTQLGKDLATLFNHFEHDSIQRDRVSESPRRLGIYAGNVAADVAKKSESTERY